MDCLVPRLSVVRFCTLKALSPESWQARVDVAELVAAVVVAEVEAVVAVVVVAAVAEAVAAVVADVVDELDDVNAEAKH
jgi:hypothetical protein